MEYCEGGDLAHYIKNNKNIPPTQILTILKQLVRAFIAMSAQGVIHRDLKP
jgi:serine/threonine-protein kinase ULK/ATG1